MFIRSLVALVRSGGVVLTLAAAACLPAAASPFRVSFESFAVEKDDDGVEHFQPVFEMAPGQVVEYRVIYENVSRTPLSALIIIGEIPEPAHFVPGSGLTQISADFEAYVDGQGWSSVPVLRQTTLPDGQITTLELPASHYKAVRWKFGHVLKPGEVISALYRVRYEY